MFADVFGGTSSASCSNYALTGTAIDKSVFGKAISEALQNNFYAKDLLNSSKDVESTKELVKDAGPVLGVYCMQLSHAITCPFSKYFQISYIFAQIFKYFAFSKFICPFSEKLHRNFKLVFLFKINCVNQPRQ